MFVKDLEKQNPIEDVDKSFATAIFYVEKELGAYITTEYPLMKFFSQLEELKGHYEREKREYDAETSKIRTMRR